MLDQAVGSTFTVNVNLSGGQNVYSVPVQIVYNPRVLQVLNVSNGTLLAQDGQTVALVNRDDSMAGILQLTASRPPGSRRHQRRRIGVHDYVPGEGSGTGNLERQPGRSEECEHAERSRQRLAGHRDRSLGAASNQQGARALCRECRAWIAPAEPRAGRFRNQSREGLK